MEAAPGWCGSNTIPMKKTFKIAALIILLTGSGFSLYYYAALPKEEGVARLRTRSHERIQQEDPICTNFGIAEKDRPAELLDLPVELSGQTDIFYHRIRLGRHTVSMAACPSEGGKDNRLWVDTNMNGRLSDEAAMPGVKKSETVEGEKHDYYDYGTFRIHTPEFKSAAIHAVGNQGSFIRVLPTECRIGKIKINKRIYQVALSDGDFDGHYTTCYMPGSSRQYPACDGILVQSRHQYYQLAPLGRYYRIDDDYYRISFSADENTLRLTKEAPAMGTLKVRDNVRLKSVSMYSDACSGWIEISRGETRLPAGRYQIFYGWVTTSDPNGDPGGQLTDFAADMRGGQFELTEGGVVTLNYGPPYTVRTRAARLPNRDSAVVIIGIDACLAGCDGEEYGLRQGQSTPPVLKIVDENDTELHSGTMEYG